MRVYLGSDHGGYELKQFIIEHLRQGEHEPIDCGAYTYDAEDDYPAFCIAAALKTVADPGSLGIVLGGSGNGEQVAANKVPGARCALGWSTDTASLARQHNNARLIGIGGRMHTVEEALAIVDAFLSTPWSEEPRHQRRVDIMADYEHPDPADGAGRAGLIVCEVPLAPTTTAPATGRRPSLFIGGRVRLQRLPAPGGGWARPF
jgi:ribose 5-phosphate isomerase B